MWHCYSRKVLFARGVEGKKTAMGPPRELQKGSRVKHRHPLRHPKIAVTRKVVKRVLQHARGNQRALAAVRLVLGAATEVAAQEL